MGYERSKKEADEEIDNVVLQTIELMDSYCSSMGRLENCLREGCVQLAKTRYVVGNRNVSDLQLPTTRPYLARTLLTTKADKVILSQHENGDDPLKRFGILVPNSLRLAQNQFCKCLESTVEAVNIKNELDYLQKKLRNLKLKKKEMN
ncbi:coiled-coil domain-containing protein 115-like [Daktulosphaira vitifoliae]|uniref:coiled-coil domain-containing protein 115-like n=1 Tax=Daktulosphaira vitifoliae TaxID=58002 RepID=UPI0021AAA28D|nr:coiled-coil domain-containing protein 115-like [Daktulosphaira vitifoliae]